MAKRKKPKLKQMIMRVPVVPGVVKSELTDRVAWESAERLSASPPKRFKFLRLEKSPFAGSLTDILIYEAYGTPKED